MKKRGTSTRTAAVVSAVIVVTTAGCTPTETSASRDPFWETTRQTNTIEAYMEYNRKAGDGPHQAESKMQIKALVAEYLKNTRDVTIVADTAESVPPACDIDVVLSTAEAVLKSQGYNTASATSPNRLVLSVSQEKVFSGTSSSYWHPTLVTHVRLAFDHAQYGRLFTQRYATIDTARDRTVQLSDLRMVPVDAARPTYINPVNGTAWGAGVQFTAGTNDPNATTTAKELRDYNWPSLFSQSNLLSGLEEQLRDKPPFSISDSTQWML